MVSFDSRPVWLKNITDNWNVSAFYAYVQVHDGVDLNAASNKMFEIIENNSSSNDSIIQAGLQPIKKIHLFHDIEDYLEGHGSIKYVYLFALLALFVLLIACFNFINLAVGQSTQRSKEIGMRKVIGAQKRQIAVQFLSETLFLTIISFIFSFVLVELFLPVINRVTDFNLIVDYNLKYVWGMAGIVVLTGFVSGIYPAFILSVFQPVRTIKGVGTREFGKIHLRKVLVIAQFAMSVLLIISAIFMFSQLNFIKNKDLGYQKDQLMYLRLRGDFANNYSVIKDELLTLSTVSQVSGGTPPIRSLMPILDGQIAGKELKDLKFSISPVESEYVSTMGMQLRSGKNFEKGNFSECILNETAVKNLGLLNPIGSIVKFTGYRGRLEKFEFSGQIVGVVEDFHHASLHKKIEPLVLYPADEFNYMCIRVQSGGVEPVLKILNKRWLEFSPEYPFEYHFIDDTLDSFYRGESRISELFLMFTILAIFISALGLLGLSMFLIERKTKEIGVRKVLGADFSNIFLVLGRQFFVWVLIGNLIAIPISWYAMQKWLQNFAYRIEITPIPFIAGASCAFAIAFLAVSWQMIKAAKTQSVVALRYE